MTTAKALLLAFCLTGVSIVVGVGTAGYIAWKETKKKLDIPDGAAASVVSTFSDFDETIATIRGDVEGSDYGKRMEALRRRHPFEPPSPRTITPAQVETFLAVKRRFGAVDAEMTADSQRDASTPSAGTLLKWNFFTRLRRLRLEQVEELERHGMSLDEFRYVQVEIYKAIMADESAARPEAKNRDYAAELDQATSRSRAEIDRKLAEGNLTGEERRRLEGARDEMARRSAALGSLANAVRDTVESVPPENIEIIRLRKQEITEVFLAGADLDSVEFFIALEQNGAGVP